MRLAAAAIRAGFRAVGSRRFQRLDELRRASRTRGREREELIASRLRALLRTAYRDVPHYHAALRTLNVDPSDIRGPQDLGRLPILRRGTVQATPQALLSKVYRPESLHRMRTTGSTGKPITFYASRTYLDWNAGGVFRSYEEAGWRLGERWVKVDRVRPRPPGRLRRLDLKFRATRARFVEGSDVRAANERTLRGMARWNPRFMIGSAQATFLLAETSSETGTGPRPRVAMVYGSMLTTPRRRTMEQAFGCPVVDSYGSVELGTVGAECQERTGFHLDDDLNWVEVVDDDGEAVSPGETGRLVITSLTSDAMPLIRYEIQDLGRLAVDACPCGRPSRRLRWLDGRTVERITKPSGGHMFPQEFNDVILHDPDALDYQVVLQGDRDLTVRIVSRRPLSEEAARRILEKFRAIDPMFRVRLEPTDQLEEGPGGKPRPFVRHP